MKKLLLLLGLAIFTSGALWAQRSITGTVTDQEGEALIGASILLKGTSTGTVTDVDGKYQITVPDGPGNVLQFSYTGFGTQEIEVGISNVIDVALEEGTVLEEVVVTEFDRFAQPTILRSNAPWRCRCQGSPRQSRPTLGHAYGGVNDPHRPL